MTLLRLMVAPRTYTNLVAAATESSTQDRALIDLTGRSTARILAHVSTAGVTGTLKAQYSLDGAAWSDPSGTVALGSTGLKASVGAAIPAPAKTIVLVRVIALGGNTTEDPVVNGAVVEIT